MNSIKQKLFELAKQSVKIPVKVGSHQISVNIENLTTCSDFIRLALQQCKINLSTTYELYERSRGIERVLKSDQLLMDIIVEWDSLDNYELIIRKSFTPAAVARSIERNSCFGSRLFEIGKRSSQCFDETHIYERVSECSLTPTPKLGSCPKSTSNKTIEKIRNKKIRKLMKSDNSLAKQVRNVKKFLNEFKGHKINYQVVNSKSNYSNSSQTLTIINELKFEPTL